MTTLKQLGLLALITLHLYAVGYLLLVSVPMAVGNGSSMIGIGLGFTTLFFTAIGTAITFTSTDDVKDQLRTLHTADLMYEANNMSNLPWYRRAVKEVLAERKEEL